MRVNQVFNIFTIIIIITWKISLCGLEEKIKERKNCKLVVFGGLWIGVYNIFLGGVTHFAGEFFEKSIFSHF